MSEYLQLENDSKSKSEMQVPEMLSSIAHAHYSWIYKILKYFISVSVKHKYQQCSKGNFLPNSQDGHWNFSSIEETYSHSSLWPLRSLHIRPKYMQFEKEL